nr:hypothetical protein [Tanacetum cinerariifolium]
TPLKRLAPREVFVTWLLVLGLIRNLLRSGKCSSLGHWRLDSSGMACDPGSVHHLHSSRMSCASGNVRYYAIVAWTHLKRLALWEVFITWPLTLGLIWNILHSGRCSSLDHWRLDSSREIHVEVQLVFMLIFPNHYGPGSTMGLKPPSDVHSAGSHVYLPVDVVGL